MPVEVVPRQVGEHGDRGHEGRAGLELVAGDLAHERAGAG